MRRAAWLLVVAAVAACQDPARLRPAEPVRTMSAPDLPPRDPFADVELAPLVCSYGGVGPHTPTGPNVWTVAMIDVAAKDAIVDAQVIALELLADDGRTVARATVPIDVRIAPSNKTAQDLSQYGTTPTKDGRFAVPANATVRLWLHAPLDTRVEHLTAPARFRLVLGTDRDGSHVTVEGPVTGPWPTA